jgi:hypothetical protein
MKLALSHILLVAAGAALAVHGSAQADSGRSLGQVRSEMNSGTWSGITIYQSPPKATPAAAGASAGAAASASAPTGGTATSTAARSGGGGLFGWGEPPSGQPLNTTKRLDSPSLGIELPVASPAASASGKGRNSP